MTMKMKLRQFWISPLKGLVATTLTSRSSEPVCRGPWTLRFLAVRSCEPHVLCATLCPTLATPWTTACQAFLSMGFPRQEYWSGLPFPSPGHLPHPGVKPRSPTVQADALLSELPGKSPILLRFL